MKAYEIIVVVDPALTEEEVEGQIGEITDMVHRENGEVREVQRWGKKRLAYAVKKRKEGYYVLFRVAAGPKVISSLERSFKISEKVIKYMTVRSEELPASSVAIEEPKTEEKGAPLEVGGEGTNG
ncbi:MAG: 30S ribosomal protein S6 [candidate division NC10 bacterium]|nr:30S ribosomal protein S6 [candidate division NC10 bacterium]